MSLVILCHPDLTYILISYIRALWRSALSARMPECRKLNMQEVQKVRNFDVIFCNRCVAVVKLGLGFVGKSGFEYLAMEMFEYLNTYNYTTSCFIKK